MLTTASKASWRAGATDAGPFCSLRGAPASRARHAPNAKASSASHAAAVQRECRARAGRAPSSPACSLSPAGRPAGQHRTSLVTAPLIARRSRQVDGKLRRLSTRPEYVSTADNPTASPTRTPSATAAMRAAWLRHCSIAISATARRARFGASGPKQALEHKGEAQAREEIVHCCGGCTGAWPASCRSGPGSTGRNRCRATAACRVSSGLMPCVVGLHRAVERKNQGPAPKASAKILLRWASPSPRISSTSARRLGLDDRHVLDRRRRDAVALGFALRPELRRLALTVGAHPVVDL